MKLEGDYLFDAPHQNVWDGLMDPEILAATMPGCEKLELIADNTYEGALNIRVGPVQGKFQGKIELKDIDSPNSYKVLIDGQGAQGFVKATAAVRLNAEGEQTRMFYSSEAQVGGRVAGVGQRLLDSSAKAIIKQSLSGLNAALQARASAPTALSESSDSGDSTDSTGADNKKGSPALASSVINTPSQADFATEVAKEVIKDLVPRPVVLTLIALVVLVVLFLVFR